LWRIELLHDGLLRLSVSDADEVDEDQFITASSDLREVAGLLPIWFIFAGTALLAAMGLSRLSRKWLPQKASG